MQYNYKLRKSEFNVELKADNEFYSMSHFDEASKAGFALTYDPDKLPNLRFNPSDKKMKQDKKVDLNVNKQTENSEYEKYDFDAENNTLTEKDVINKFNSIVEKENEEDEIQTEMDKTNKIINSYNLNNNQKDLNIKNINAEKPRQKESVNYDDNQEDTEEEVFRKKEVLNTNYFKNNTNNPYINIINESPKNTRKSPALNNNFDLGKSQTQIPLIKTPEVKKKSLPVNKKLPSSNDFFMNDDELVKKFNEIKQTNTFKKFVMKQENCSQVIQLIENTRISNALGYSKRNDLRESGKTPVKKPNTRTPAKINDVEDNNLSSFKKKTNTNLEGNRIHVLEEENVKLKNKIRVLEQSKSLSITEDLQDEVHHLKDIINEKNDELEQLQMKFDKKNRENIENKSKYEALQFDNELLQNKITVIIQLYRT